MLNSIRPLHIGKFIPPPYAGIEAHVDTLLCALSQQIEATLVASDAHQKHGRPLPKAPYRILAARSYATFASTAISPGLLPLVQREFHAGRANILHTHAPNPWGDATALFASKNTPVVMTWHSDIVRQKTLLKLYRGFQQRALQRADRIVVFTPKHYESSQQLKLDGIEKKIVTVPIGIDFSRLDSDREGANVLASIRQWVAGRPVLLTVGRHVYYKGYEHLISAVHKMRSDAVLLMIGTGPLSPVLRQQVEALGLSDRVRFLGEVDEPTLVAALHYCDVFCLPSIEPSEAFGIASAEAMACGKPTVVCELNNGVNYLNQNGTTSLVVPPKNEAALADAMDQLIQDDTLRQQMGAAACKWVRSQFSVEAMRDGTLDLYRSLC